MNILFLSSWFPYPPDNGSRNRIYNLVKALSIRHHILLIALLQSDSDPANATELAEFCEVISLHLSGGFKPHSLKAILGLLSRYPRSITSTFDSTVAESIRDVIAGNHIDAAIVSHGMQQYRPYCADIPSVLDLHRCETAVLESGIRMATGPAGRLRRTLGWCKHSRWEAAVSREFDSIAVVSEDDRRALLRVAPDLKQITEVPNGVDTCWYTPGRHRPRRGDLVYSGALSFDANLDAVRYYAHSIYPILRSRMPEVKLRVTGRTSGVDLRGIDDCPGVELVGYVDDIRTVLQRSSVCVVPLRQGGGSRLKILEAMAAGVPVVSTSVGAEGIDCIPGKHLLIADDPEGFAAAIESVLRDHDLAKHLSTEARALVESRYSWATIGESFVKLVEDTVTTRRAH